MEINRWEEVNCCVCLKRGQNCSTVSYDQHGTQLKIFIPEVEWDSSWQICRVCCKFIDRLRKFRELCLKSDITRKAQLEVRVEDVEQVDIKVVSGTSETDDRTFKTEQDLKTDCGKVLVDDDESDLKTDIVQSCEKPAGVKCDQKDKRKSTRSVRTRANTQLKSHECLKCGKTFSTSTHLLQHKKYHDGQRVNVCSYCGKGFITHSDLKNHEKYHLNKREYKCKLCSKGYNTHKDVRTHYIVVHSDPATWRHVCPHCEKRFPQKSGLDLHVRRHTGDKRFACHLCDKRFVDKVVMQKHVGSHSNVRPHACPSCSKEYKDRKVLELHLARVHGIGDVVVPIKVREKKYLCSQCPKAFYDKSKLTKHEYSHSGERPFTCGVCAKGFTDRSYISKHLRTVHNIEHIDDV